ncbi:unnamed protein product [Amoebophrya sp. A25]|nr:unnamed protein product [Amoebophrya sp. A25]|eukprot:GSA25T00007093001.1
MVKASEDAASARLLPQQPFTSSESFFHGTMRLLRGSSSFKTDCHDDQLGDDMDFDTSNRAAANITCRQNSTTSDDSGAILRSISTTSSSKNSEPDHHNNDITSSRGNIDDSNFYYTSSSRLHQFHRTTSPSEDRRNSNCSSSTRGCFPTGCTNSGGAGAPAPSTSVGDEKDEASLSSREMNGAITRLTERVLVEHQTGSEMKKEWLQHRLEVEEEVAPPPVFDTAQLKAFGHCFQEEKRDSNIRGLSKNRREREHVAEEKQQILKKTTSAPGTSARPKHHVVVVMKEQRKSDSSSSSPTSTDEQVVRNQRITSTAKKKIILESRIGEDHARTDKNHINLQANANKQLLVGGQQPCPPLVLPKNRYSILGEDTDDYIEPRCAESKEDLIVHPLLVLEAVSKDHPTSSCNKTSTSSSCSSSNGGSAGKESERRSGNSKKGGRKNLVHQESHLHRPSCSSTNQSSPRRPPGTPSTTRGTSSSTTTSSCNNHNNETSSSMNGIKTPLLSRTTSCGVVSSNLSTSSPRNSASSSVRRNNRLLKFFFRQPPLIELPVELRNSVHESECSSRTSASGEPTSVKAPLRSSSYRVEFPWKDDDDVLPPRGQLQQEQEEQGILYDQHEDDDEEILAEEVAGEIQVEDIKVDHVLQRDESVRVDEQAAAQPGSSGGSSSSTSTSKSNGGGKSKNGRVSSCGGGEKTVTATGDDESDSTISSLGLAAAASSPESLLSFRGPPASRTPSPHFRASPSRGDLSTPGSRASSPFRVLPKHGGRLELHPPPLPPILEKETSEETVGGTPISRRNNMETRGHTIFTRGTSETSSISSSSLFATMMEQGNSNQYVAVGDGADTIHLRRNSNSCENMLETDEAHHADLDVVDEQELVNEDSTTCNAAAASASTTSSTTNYNAVDEKLLEGVAAVNNEQEQTSSCSSTAAAAAPVVAEELKNSSSSSAGSSITSITEGATVLTTPGLDEVQETTPDTDGYRTSESSETRPSSEDGNTTQNGRTNFDTVEDEDVVRQDHEVENLAAVGTGEDSVLLVSPAGSSCKGVAPDPALEVAEAAAPVVVETKSLIMLSDAQHGNKQEVSSHVVNTSDAAGPPPRPPVPAKDAPPSISTVVPPSSTMIAGPPRPPRLISSAAGAEQSARPVVASGPPRPPPSSTSSSASTTKFGPAEPPPRRSPFDTKHPTNSISRFPNIVGIVGPAWQKVTGLSWPGDIDSRYYERMQAAERRYTTRDVDQGSQLKKKKEQPVPIGNNGGTKNYVEHMVAVVDKKYEVSKDVLHKKTEDSSAGSDEVEDPEVTAAAATTSSMDKATDMDSEEIASRTSGLVCDETAWINSGLCSLAGQAAQNDFHQRRKGWGSSSSCNSTASTTRSRTTISAEAASKEAPSKSNANFYVAAVPAPALPPLQRTTRPSARSSSNRRTTLEAQDDAVFNEESGGGCTSREEDKAQRLRDSRARRRQQQRNRRKCKAITAAAGGRGEVQVGLLDVGTAGGGRDDNSAQMIGGTSRTTSITSHYSGHGSSIEAELLGRLGGTREFDASSPTSTMTSFCSSSTASQNDSKNDRRSCTGSSTTAASRTTAFGQVTRPPPPTPMCSVATTLSRGSSPLPLSCVTPRGGRKPSSSTEGLLAVKTADSSAAITAGGGGAGGDAAKDGVVGFGAVVGATTSQTGTSSTSSYPECHDEWSVEDRQRSGSYLVVNNEKVALTNRWESEALQAMQFHREALGHEDWERLKSSSSLLRYDVALVSHQLAGSMRMFHDPHRMRRKLSHGDDEDVGEELSYDIGKYYRGGGPAGDQQVEYNKKCYDVTGPRRGGSGNFAGDAKQGAGDGAGRETTASGNCNNGKNEETGDNGVDESTGDAVVPRSSRSDALVVTDKRDHNPVQQGEHDNAPAPCSEDELQQEQAQRLPLK